MTTITGNGSVTNQGVFVYTWSGMGDDDVGVGVETARFPDVTISITGTYLSATVTIEGSNDGGANWVILTNPGATALSFTTGNKIEVVLQNPLLIRPKTAGGSMTDMDIILVGHVSK